MEIKQENEHDVELCDVNKWDMKPDITQKTVDGPNSSARFPFQDEYLYSGDIKVKLEDDSLELYLLRHTDVSKVLKNNTGNEELKGNIVQHEHIQDTISLGGKEENCFRSKCQQLHCHVGVDQKDMNDECNTQQSDIMKYDAIAESISDHKSLFKNGNISFIDNINLIAETVKQMLTEATEPVLDRNCQTVNAGIITNQTDDNLKFPDANKCQLGGFNQPVLGVFTDTDRRLSTEIFNSPVSHTEFTESVHLMTHKQIHTEDFPEKNYHTIHNCDKPYVCHDCGFSFKQSSDLKKHKRVHTGEKPYKCDVCDYSSARSDELKNHRRIHTGELPYKCDICDYSYAWSGALKKHKRIHKGETPYKCDVCDYSSSHRSVLRRHKIIHTGEKPYKCEVCDYSSAWSSALKKHKRIHTGEISFKCDVCDYSSAQRSVLRKHKRIHTGEKPYKCDICDYSSARSVALKKHRRIHTGEKPYKCDVCDYSSARSDQLKFHRRIHTGEKPYKCDVCGYYFARSGTLKMHRRIHTGEKPYKCDVCEFSSAHSSGLKKHRRIHTG